MHAPDVDVNTEVPDESEWDQVEASAELPTIPETSETAHPTQRSNQNVQARDEHATIFVVPTEVSGPVGIHSNLPDQHVRQGTRFRAPTKRLVYDEPGKPHWSSSAGPTISGGPAPRNLREVLQDPNKDSWLHAMAEEEKSIMYLDTYTETDPPPGAKVISSKWVLKTKVRSDGSLKYKARVVAKGFMQRFGKDYEEVFTPTLSYKTFRFLCALSVCRGFYVHQLDIKTAFLHANIDREGIYIRPPDGTKTVARKDKRQFKQGRLPKTARRPFLLLKRLGSLTGNNLFIRR